MCTGHRPSLVSTLAQGCGAEGVAASSVAGGAVSKRGRGGGGVPCTLAVRAQGDGGGAAPGEGVGQMHGVVVRWGGEHMLSASQPVPCDRVSAHVLHAIALPRYWTWATWRGWGRTSGWTCCNGWRRGGACWTCRRELQACMGWGVTLGMCGMQVAALLCMRGGCMRLLVVTCACAGI